MRIRKSNGVWSSNSASLQSSGTRVSTISGNETSTTNYPDCKAVYDAVHPVVQSSEPSSGMLPNIPYDFGELDGNTTFTLATPTDAAIDNHYYWTFETPTTVPTITLPTGITWKGGSTPTFSANKHYEISVRNNIGIVMEV